MPRSRWLTTSLSAWFLVWVFWLIVTRGFHPTMWLTFVVTTLLIGACAAVFYVDLLVLVPRYWERGSWVWYGAWLGAMMALLTWVALVVLRLEYARTVGPDPDPYGFYKHYVIDLSGVAAHVAAAKTLVWAWKSWWRERDGESGSRSE